MGRVEWLCVLGRLQMARFEPLAFLIRKLGVVAPPPRTSLLTDGPFDGKGTGTTRNMSSTTAEKLKLPVEVVGADCRYAFEYILDY